MEKDCSTCLYKEGLCYPSTTIFNKDKTCRSYTPDYEGYIAELEKENNELKTVKIPQLERKIASIRGTHSVDCKKLNARTEQVERLKKEYASSATSDRGYYYEGLKEGFFDGLITGRPKWHKVSEQIPTEEKEYLVKLTDGTVDVMTVALDGDLEPYLLTPKFDFYKDVEKWCEIPKE